MARFHSLTVKDIQKETRDCISVAFDLPVELHSEFQFIQGQYLTLRSWIDGEEVRRSYSLCSSPLDRELRVAIKHIPDGKFSSFAHTTLKEGDVLDVMSPMGNFYSTLSSEHQKKYVAFAAGSGITPIMSIMKTVLRTEANSQFTLCYGNRSVSSIIFREEIEGLKNQYLDRLQIHHFLTREELDVPLFNGRFSEEKLARIFATLLEPVSVDEYFLCGPEEMIRTIEKELLEAGVSAKRIHKELFVASSPQTKTKVAASERSDLTCEVIVKDGGKQFRFDWEMDAENLLDAALGYGADLPYACKGGVCCTCKAKLVEGKVEMEVNYALEEEEVEAGYILTCQARPLTNKVIVDYDLAL